MLKKIPWKQAASSREIAIWFSLLLLCLFFLSKKGFGPATQDLKSASAQIEAKKVELKAIQSFSKDKNGESTPGAHGRNSGRQAVVAKVQQSFKDAKTVPDVVVSELLTSLTQPRYAKAALLEKFSFVAEKKQPGFTELTLDLQLVGSYAGIAQFLRSMGNLPYLIKVETVDLQPLSAEDPDLVQMAGKTVLYVPDPKTAFSAKASLADTGADLMLPLSASKSQPFQERSRGMSSWSVQELKLTATMAGGPRPTALINGKIFALGDKIAEFRLAEIHPQEAILQRGEIRHALKLIQDLPSEDGRNEENVAGEADLENRSGRAEDGEPEAGDGEPEEGKPAEARNEEEGSEKEGGEFASLDQVDRPAVAPVGGIEPKSGEDGPPDEDSNPVYTDNRNGVLTPEKEASLPSAPVPPEDPPDSPDDSTFTVKTRLNPYQVEDVESIPFEELQDPTQLAKQG